MNKRINHGSFSHPSLVVPYWNTGVFVAPIIGHTLKRSSLTTLGLKSPHPDKITRDDFYIESLFIQVEDVFFEVPRYYFEQHSDMAALFSPRPREKHGAGWYRDRPITLKGFLAKEFGTFLRLNLDFLFGPLQSLGLSSELPTPPTPPSSPVKHSPNSVGKKAYSHSASLAARLKKFRESSWETILKVATLLGFRNEREQAIRALTPLLGPTSSKEGLSRRVYLARLYQVEPWLSDAYKSLVQREMTLDDDEVKVLGYDVAIRLLRMRDKGSKLTNSIEETINRMVISELASEQKVGIRLSTSYKKAADTCETSASKSFINSLYPSDNPNQDNSSYRPYHTVAFKLQDTLFRVPTKILTDAFCDLVDTHTGESAREPEDGRVIELTDVHPIEFKALLHAIWPKNLKLNDVKMVEDSAYWISVLKLTTKWSMQKVRSQAIVQVSNQLEKLTRGNAMEKVALAKLYHVRPWLIEAYQTLAERNEGISFTECTRLGWDAAYRLMSLRDVNRRLKVTKDAKGKVEWKFVRVSLGEVEKQFRY